MTDSLLEVTDLRVSIPTRDGVVAAVRGVDMALARGEILGLVGESGCGKSMTALALLRLLPGNARLRARQLRFADRDLLSLSERRYRALRGADIGIIFQNPMSALNPTMRIGDQIGEVLRVHKNLSRREARRRAVALLERMGIAAAGRRARQYPFEFSGGMLQRAMIAMSVACEPQLLIADEPTTALDVTVQAQVLDLLRDLQRERQMSLLLITHDLAVVRQYAHRVAVMYAGEVVEQGPVQSVFDHPRHPYTQGLQQSLPATHVGGRRERLVAIAGSPPDLAAPPRACAFTPRCPYAMQVCEREAPPFAPVSDAVASRCWLWHPDLADRNPLQGGGGGGHG